LAVLIGPGIEAGPILALAGEIFGSQPADA